MPELKICRHGIIEKCCAACAKSNPILEVVIVNTRNREWVSRLQYALEKAGLVLAEDYLMNTDRVLVFNEQPK